MLSCLDLDRAELGVLLTDDARIRELNEKHRHKAKPTDVLAFPMDERGAGPSGVRLLGDVVISLDTAARQARQRRRPLLDEVIHLLSHGLLHLVGYDHRTDAEERRMNEAAAALVAASKQPPARSRILSAPHARSTLTSRAR